MISKTECPLKKETPNCKICPFSKETLCDFPYIRAKKMDIKVIMGEERG